MITLSINQNQASYLGSFVAPAFNLWSDRHKLVESMYQVFSGYGGNLNNIRLESLGRSPGGEAIVVESDDIGIYKLRYDHVEWTFNDFTNEDIERVPEILSVAEKWLRSGNVGLQYKTHVLAYMSHCSISKGTVQDYLRGISKNSISGLGQDHGSGMIFNWLDNDLGGEAQFTINHSRVVSNGIYVEFIGTINNDHIDFNNSVKLVRGKLTYVLSALGLEIEQEEEV